MPTAQGGSGSGNSCSGNRHGQDSRWNTSGGDWSQSEGSWKSRRGSWSQSDNWRRESQSDNWRRESQSENWRREEWEHSTGDWQWNQSDNAWASKEVDTELEACKDENERRQLLMRREVQKNLEKMALKEQQRQQEEAAKEAKAQKLKDERDQKVREHVEAQDKKFAAAMEAQERQRLEEAERKRKIEESAKRGRGLKRATRPDQLRKEQKQAEMERQAAEVLANIAAATSKKNDEVEPTDTEKKAETSEVLTTEASIRVRQKRKPIGPSMRMSEAEEALEAEMPAPVLEPRKKGVSTSSSSSSKAAMPVKQKKAMWWHKIDVECPISLAPICELPQPPFALEPCGAAEPHYFDARFLANYLASSCDFIDPMNRRPLTREECVALDEHLRWYYPEQQFIIVADAFDLFERNVGGEVGTSVQREATSVLQHLFRFSSSRRTDARGRAVNYRDGGLTVVDDDDVLAPDASAPARPTRPMPVDEAEAFPSLPSDAPAPKAKAKSKAYPGPCRCPPGAETFPTLLGSSPALKGAWQKRQSSAQGSTAAASSPVSEKMAAKKRAAEMSAKIAAARADHESRRVDHWEDWA